MEFSVAFRQHGIGRRDMKAASPKDASGDQVGEFVGGSCSPGDLEAGQQIWRRSAIGSGSTVARDPFLMNAGAAWLLRSYRDVSLMCTQASPRGRWSEDASRIFVAMVRRGRTLPIDIVVVHVVAMHGFSVSGHLHRLRERLPPSHTANTIALGDFNIAATDEGRFDIATGTTQFGDGRDDQQLHDIVARFGEVVPDGYST